MIQTLIEEKNKELDEQRTQWKTDVDKNDQKLKPDDDKNLLIEEFAEENTEDLDK